MAERNIKTEKQMLYITQAEKDILLKKAEENNMSLSEYIRMSCLEDNKKFSKADEKKYFDMLLKEYEKVGV